MPHIRSICVYCGSSMGFHSRFRTSAETLGIRLAQAGVELVYGGGNIGLMGILANAAIGAGGRVVGVIPEDLKHAELAHPGADELIVVKSMHERKQAMFERADAFVALPGGPGTLDEFIEVITWRQLRLHGKPVLIVDEGGYWRPLLDLFDHIIDHGFARDSLRSLFTVVGGVEDVLPTLERLPVVGASTRPDRL